MPADNPPRPPGPPRSARALVAWLVLLLVLSGLALRLEWMQRSSLWCDEAESSINAFAILETGLPVGTYLGLPVYENTLTDPWPEHPEYEFRDSSYSARNLAVYHGWIPLYSIAASQALFGLRPDRVVTPPRVQHGPDQIAWRTTVPRLPAVLASVGTMVLAFLVARQLAGATAGLASLTLMAWNARTVDFGYQARYYSLTLFTTVLAAWCLVRVVKHGRWRDFLALGLASAALFHTHQFSAVVFGGVAVLCAPLIIRHRGWWPRSLAGGGLAVLLVVPWLFLSGFLTTASTIPKTYRLFESGTDWLLYGLQRPDQLLLVALLALIVALVRWLPAQLSGVHSEALRRHGFIYGLLLAWLILAYAAFHLIVPAASFFYERLSLVLWTPYVLLMGVFTADVLRLLRLQPRRAAVLAVVAMTALLLARNRLAFFESPSIVDRRAGVAAVLEVLGSRTFAPETRFYATPNEHLVYTYYAGLPVQSIAPVRRSFLEQRSTPVVFIEYAMDVPYPDDDEVLALDLSGDNGTDEHSRWAISRALWMEGLRADLAARGLPAPPMSELPEEWRSLAEATRIRSQRERAKHLQGLRSLPIFRAVETSSIRDLWLGFFYRFVDPAERIGARLNILPRLQTAEVVPVPEAAAVVFFDPSPPTTGP